MLHCLYVQLPWLSGRQRQFGVLLLLVGAALILASRPVGAVVYLDELLRRVTDDNIVVGSARYLRLARVLPVRLRNLMRLTAGKVAADAHALCICSITIVLVDDVAAVVDKVREWMKLSGRVLVWDALLLASRRLILDFHLLNLGRLDGLRH